MNFQIKLPLSLDVSHWEPEIRWQQLSPRPVIVITKASEGKAYRDPLLAAHWAGMTSITTLRGLYHFFHPHDVSGQIANYLSQCQLVNAWDGRNWLAEIDPILDMEYEPPATLPRNRRPRGYVEPVRGSALAGQIKAWLDGVENATGRRPIIYCRATGWIHTFDALGRPPAWTGDYKVWAAGYPNNPDQFATLPDVYMPKGFREWIMWQYSESAILPGIPFDGVDVNLINPVWLATLNVPISPQPPIPGESPLDVLRSYELQTLRNGEVRLT